MMLGIIQARVSSSRLPGKVLKPILGKPMLAHQIERVLRANSLERLVLATSTETLDDPLVALASAAGIPCWRGSLEDVLDRFVGAGRAYGATHVVRLTGDCPLADPELIDAVVAHYRASGGDYASNTSPPTFPDGLDVEVMSMAALERAWREATLPSEREHVTRYIYERPAQFRLVNYAGIKDLSQFRWTVDNPEDFAVVTALYEALYPVNPNFTTLDILATIARRPELVRANAHIIRNEGLVWSLQKDRGELQ